MRKIDRLELISRLMLDLLFFIKLNIYFNLTVKKQPIRVSIVKPKKKSETENFLIFFSQSLIELSFVGIQQGYPKERIKYKRED